ncbi:MAG: amidase [Gemmatimonadota bacterium]
MSTFLPPVRALAAGLAAAGAAPAPHAAVPPGVVASGTLPPGSMWTAQACYAVLAAAAVSPAGAADVLAGHRNAPLLTAVAREVLAQAPVPPLPIAGFTPADLAGSLGWLAGWLKAAGPAADPAAVDPGEAAAVLARLATAAGAPLLARLAELTRAIGHGTRSRCAGNLDLLAGHERLERLGRPLNAVVSAIGAPARAGTGPLAGRLAAVKDIIAVAGVPTRCGSPASDPAPAARDATVVARLREAGAEVFATTQCLEYAAGFAHPAIGGTRNPLDSSRTSGGSSGGSAALVAAGVCDLALGTDTGGSVRIPAAYCGVVGLKPTYGLLPADGIFPLSPACDHAGILTATVRDAADLLAVLAGAADSSAADGPPPRSPSAPGGGPAFTVGVLSAQLTDPSVTPPVRAAISAALDALADAGWRVRELSAPWLGQPGRWDEALAAIVAREAFLVHCARDTAGYAEGTRALLEFGASVTPSRLAAALAAQAELTAAVTASLAEVDVLAGPAVGYQAPEEDPPFGVGEDSGESRFTGPYNLTGHPAVSLPAPAAGLPAGLQLAGQRGADRALLRVAAAAETVLAGAR